MPIMRSPSPKHLYKLNFRWLWWKEQMQFIWYGISIQKWWRGFLRSHWRYQRLLANHTEGAAGFSLNLSSNNLVGPAFGIPTSERDEPNICTTLLKEQVRKRSVHWISNQSILDVTGDIYILSFTVQSYSTEDFVTSLVTELKPQNSLKPD